LLPISHFVVRLEPCLVLFILNDETKPSACATGAPNSIGKMVCRKKLCRNRDWHMRSGRIFLSLAISIGCGIAGQNPAFSQEYRGTVEQQLACTPDVFRLCGEQIPDVNRIVACLRQNTPQLSGRCRAVFESNISAPDQAAPGRRAGQ
jgi:hypothetical protein